MTSSLDNYIRLMYKSQITGMLFNATDDSMQIELLRTPEEPTFIISISGIAHVAFSRTLSDGEPPWFVVNMTLNHLSDHGAELLSKLKYCFTMISRSVPKSVYHLHMEGDICLDVVAANITVFQSI